ncbi:hypothetical protein [Oceanicella actignis]|uniref:Beta-barrel porin 2 n=1 Tax=Oceanicella actignis TaxID=1189325 RepID=A0A1M7SVY4_9RHOB|nr:hypothetical protein [Oceanicella actignis]SES73414.1 hypothetical protein SAMN04488119_101314 [Oceanicella actignis]SHN62639.1 hypothetical protein SAMN05216200_103315 [Oceanicella actignis]
MARMRTTPAARRRALAATAAAAAAALAGPGAADQSLRATLSQTFAAATNPTLATDGGDSGLRSTTRLNLAYALETPRSSLSLATGVDATLATGDAEDDLTGLFPDLSAAYAYAFDDATLRGTFGLVVRPVNYLATEGVLVVDEGGEVAIEDRDFEDTSTEITWRAGLSLSHEINARNSVSLSFNVRDTDYSSVAAGSTLTPTRTISAGAGWSVALTPRTGAGLNTSLSRFEADDARDRESWTWSANASVSHDATPRLSLSGRLGPAVTFSKRTSTITGRRESDTQLSADAGFGLRYEGPDTVYSLGLSNDVTPSSLGALSNVASLRLGLSHAVNADTSLGANATVAFRTALSSTDEDTIEDQLSTGFGMSVSHALTRTVDLTAGYSYFWRDTEGARGDNHRVYLTLSKRFDLLP